MRLSGHPHPRPGTTLSHKTIEENARTAADLYWNNSSYRLAEVAQNRTIWPLLSPASAASGRWVGMTCGAW
jgi:hypothetical protein